ncbi:uncharacterized protein LOC105181188 [Harpegnathos saltator]|uniref:uncharacterized protein LOC105181188 n=1 Tax=Harpegnathos saltator TaxID=610380 RepID=UPI00058C9836|nr:uncharacterized protein LOC105181188 [Harpegnathos saltator]XP_025160573.1 uncharacterized protein LOC105181188 [Harpegnathos saltator]
MIMEMLQERMSTESENDNENIYSYYTYCRTEVTSRTFTSVWNLRDFWTIYETMTVLQLNTDDEQLPFNIFMKVDRKDEKFTFYIKHSSPDKRLTYNVMLQSVVSDRYHTIPSRYDDDQLSYEVTKSLLTEELKGFVTRDTLRVVVKVYTVECIVHNTIYTTVLHNYTIQNYKTDIKNLPLCNSSTFVAFRVDDREILVNTELLSARSNYFRDLFKNNRPENITIDVDDVSLEVVITFQTFIQYGNTSFLKYSDIHRLFSLFIMAKRYGVSDLGIICEQYIKELLLQKENIFRCDVSLDVLFFAYENDVKDLLQFAVNFIALNINDHINTKKFIDIIQKYPTLLSLLNEAKINTRKAYYQF